MKLILIELDSDNLYQEISPTENQNLYAVRPHIYKHLAPAGSLFMQIQDSLGSVIANSETIAISTISSANYFHGYVRFLFNVSLKADTIYRLSMRSVGYNYSSSAYIGWVKDWDLKKYNDSYSALTTSSALDFEAWNSKEILRGN